MKHKPYPKYKPSGIDWIGDIPEGWGILRLKFIASTKFSNVDKHSKEEEQPVSLCNYVDVYYNDFIDSNMDFMQATATNDEIRKFALNKGDVIVTKDSESWDDIAIPAYVKEDMQGVLCGYHLAMIQANQNMHGEYIFWSFLSQIINYQFQVSATGVTRYGLGKGSLDNAMFFVPSKKEQHQIAKYLDQKTARIDDLIQKKEEMIKLLKEKRAAIINQAVTKGLDPNAKMKPSGIDWIGNIPDGWDVKKLAYISDIVLGKMLTPNDKGAYYLKYYLRAKNLGWLSVNVDDVKEMWFSSRELKIYRLQRDDLLVSEGGEVGRTCIWNDELEECYIQNSVNMVRVKKRMIAKYFLYQFYALGYGGYFESIVNRISIGHLTKEKLSSVKFLVPSAEAQQQIAAFLDKKTTEIDYLINKIKSAIAKLREYRSSLITAAVTGKIDVRGAVKC